MFNAIPANTVFGANNPFLEQSNLVKVPHEIRTHNNEQLSARSVAEIKKNAKSRSSGKKHSHDDEEEPEAGDGQPWSQPQPRPNMQERLQMAKQGKVSLNQRAVTALFLQQATSGASHHKTDQSVEEHPSIDVVA
ncbi:MAG: hypothetical protein H7839_07175 [Magnetococcus sp. YQC-5]